MSTVNSLGISLAAFGVVYYFLKIRRKDPIASSTPELRRRGGDFRLEEMFHVPNERL